MHPDRRLLLWLNVLGGVAVLGSYGVWLAANPGAGEALWGGVPEALRPLYTVNMFLAAAGYFAFSAFVFFRLDPDRTRVAGRFGYRLFHALYALILVPSALWLPLTFEMIEAPSDALWLAIRVVLLTVGFASLGLLAAVATAAPHAAPGARRLALAGAIAFSLQTAVLDALVWTAFFPV